MSELFNLVVFQSHKYESADEKRIMTPHRHPTIEISYIISGELTLEYTSASTGKTIQETIYSNQFFIIRPDCLHCTQIPHTLNSIGLELFPTSNDFEATLKQSEFFQSLPFAKKTLQSFEDILILNDTHNLRYILNGFQKFTDEPQDEFFPYSFNIQLRRLMIEILKCVQSAPTISQYNPYLKKALSFIESNYKKNISAKNIAVYLDISIGYLQQLFRQNLQCSINDYINKERIRQAKYLIANSNYSFSLIASSVGYHSVQTFISNFHKFEKMTPSEFKATTIKKTQTYSVFADGEYALPPSL